MKRDRPRRWSAAPGRATPTARGSTCMPTPPCAPATGVQATSNGSAAMFLRPPVAQGALGVSDVPPDGPPHHRAGLLSQDGAASGVDERSAHYAPSSYGLSARWRLLADTGRALRARSPRPLLRLVCLVQRSRRQRWLLQEITERLPGRV